MILVEGYGVALSMISYVASVSPRWPPSVPQRWKYSVWCGQRIEMCDDSSCNEGPCKAEVFDAAPLNPTIRRHGERYLVMVPKPSMRAAMITIGADMSAEVGANGSADMGANMGKIGGVIGGQMGTIVTSSTTTITTVTTPIGARPRPRTTDAIATEATRLIIELGQGLTLVLGAPVAIGAGCSSLRYKLHDPADSKRFHATSFVGLTRNLKSSFACSGDMGTEKELPCCKVSLRSLFGDWIANEKVSSSVDVDADDDAQDDLGLSVIPILDNGGGAADPLIVDEDLGLEIMEVASEPAEERGGDNDDVEEPSGDHDDASGDLDEYLIDVLALNFVQGDLHVLHSVTKGLGTALEYFPTWFASLKQVCRLLSCKWSRKRFLARCCVGNCAGYRDKFATFSGKIYKGRWASVMDHLSDLLSVMHILRYVWDKERFGQTNQRADDGDDDVDDDVHGSSSIKVDVVDAAIRSRLFWSYGLMVHKIGEVIQEVVAWVEI